MSKVTFILGGCRSGKSRYALQLAEASPGTKKVYVATCIPQDQEMEQRVARHRKDRGSEWETLESPLELAQTLKEWSRNDHVLLVDCLTMWVSNLLMQNADPEQLRGHAQVLAGQLGSGAGQVILVSNEVGAGVVPDNALARTFRDAVGELNQIVASVAQTVFWTAAGIPMRIK